MPESNLTALMPGALAGIRVIEIASRSWSSTTLTGRILSDMGAEVLRLLDQSDASLSRGSADQGPPDAGAGPAAMAARGKQTQALDLTNAGIGALRELLRRTDILLVDRETVAALNASGLSIDLIQEIAPACIVTCLSPFGLSGPWRDLPASELTLQALAGVMTTNGYAGDPPVRAGIPVAAIAGSLLAGVSTLAALVECAKSGRGQFVDHSEYDTLVALLGTLLPSYFLTGGAFRQIGNHHGMGSPWNSYRTADGWVVICTISDSHFAILATAMDQPELVTDPRFVDATSRVANAAEIDSVVETWTSNYSTKHVIEYLTSAGLAVGPIKTIDEVLKDPQARHRGVVVPTNVGFYPGPFIRLARTPLRLPLDIDSKSDVGDLWTQERPVPPASKLGADMNGPLHGLTVIEVASLTAGPVIGRLLGMLGARVIKIEPRKGEGSRHLPQRVAGESYLYHINNTDKLGVTLEMEDSNDQSSIRRLVSGADAFLTNMSESTLAASQLSGDDLLAINPQLVYCSLSGYGSDGPLGGRKMVDMVAQAASGIMSLTGFPTSEPLKTAVSISDLLGAYAGTLGVLAAIIARQRFGVGQQVEATLYDVSVWSTQEEWWRAEVAIGPDRDGNRHSRHSPHNTFAASDGVVAIGVETDEQWARLAHLIGHSEPTDGDRFALEANRSAAVAEVESLVAAWVEHRRAEEVVERCLTVGVPAAIPHQLTEVGESEQATAREMLLTLDYPDYGPLRYIGSPLKLSRTPARIRALAPRLGAHNAILL